jgi:hypothetical protein
MSEERIERLLTALAGEVAAMRAEMATKAEIAALRAEMARDVAALRAEMARDLAALRAEMATKDDFAREIATIRGEMATKDDFAREIATIRGEMATKDDLAGVARNVDVTAIGRQLRDLPAMKDDITVLTAIVQRLDNTMVRQIADLLTEVRAEHRRMDRLLDRVRALEAEEPTPVGP